MRKLSKAHFENIAPYCVFVFFGALLFSRLSQVPYLVFDEIHYIPAAKSIFSLKHNINWEHPPLAKWILGLWVWFFSTKLHLFSDVVSARVCTSLLGLFTLGALWELLKTMGFQTRAILAAVVITASNVLWFVISKTAILDIFYVCFGMWGIVFLAKSQHHQKKSYFNYLCGWSLLGLSCASKWSGFCFVLMAALFLHKRKLADHLMAVAVFLGTYFLTFLPLYFLKSEPLQNLEDLFNLHLWIFQSLKQIPFGQFEYTSQVWDWPFMLRPVWFYFESFSEKGTNLDRGIWCGGNPVVFWGSMISFALLCLYRFRKRIRTTKVLQDQADWLLVFFLSPLVFWSLVPRGFKMFYYYLPSSLFLGPIIVWSLNAYFKPNEKKKFYNALLLGTSMLSLILFFYFLPILDGRAMPEESYRQMMWLRSWM